MKHFLKNTLIIIKCKLNEFPIFKSFILILVSGVPGLKNWLRRIGHSEPKERVNLTTRGRKIYLDLLFLIKRND